MKSNNNSTAHILLFALVLSFCLGAIVTIVSVLLAPVQAENRNKEQQQLLLDLMGNLPGFENIATQNASFQMKHRLVHLRTGCYNLTINAGDFAMEADPSDPKRRTSLDNSQDIAQIGDVPNFALVHLVLDDGQLEAIILPVYGLGYGSQLNGYLTLANDSNTIRALTFYDHGETPGMGGRISAPAWQDQWIAKRLRDVNGELRIGVATTSQHKDNASLYQIDAMTGATATGRGVTNLLRFWVGPLGFGPYLNNLVTQADCLDHKT